MGRRTFQMLHRGHSFGVATSDDYESDLVEFGRRVAGLIESENEYRWSALHDLIEEISELP